MSVHSTRLPFLRRAVCIDDGPAPEGAFESWSDFVAGDLKASGGAGRRDRRRGGANRSRHGVLSRPARPRNPRPCCTRIVPRPFSAGAGLASLAIDPDVRTWAANGFFWSGNFAQAMGSTFSAGGCLVLQRYFDPGEALKLMQVERVSLPARLAPSVGAAGGRSSLERGRPELPALCGRESAAHASHRQGRLAGTAGPPTATRKRSR